MGAPKFLRLDMTRTALLACVFIVTFALVSSEDSQDFDGQTRPSQAELTQETTEASFRFNHRTKLTRSEKRAVRTEAFRRDLSSQKLHDKAENAEVDVKTDLQGEMNSKAFKHGGVDEKLSMAISKCDALKLATFWKCNRLTCAYHAKCSDKFQRHECKVEADEKKAKERKKKQMEKFNKHMEPIHKKQAKELAKKHVLHLKRAAAKEAYYKSQAPERKKKEKHHKHLEKIKAEVRKKYAAEIKKWASKYGGGSELLEATDTLNDKKMVDAEELMKKQSIKKEKSDKEIKQKVKKHNSKACKARFDAAYNHCRADTRQAYKVCFKILKQANDFFHNYKKARKSLEGFEHTGHAKALAKHKHSMKLKLKLKLSKKHGKSKGKKHGKSKGKKHGKKHSKHIKKVLHHLKKAVKAFVKKKAESKQVLADKAKAKKYSIGAADALRKAEDLTKVKDYKDATVMGKLAVHLSSKKISAEVKVADDEEHVAKKATKGKKKAKAKKVMASLYQQQARLYKDNLTPEDEEMESLYQQQARLYEDNLTPESLYEMQENMYEESLSQ